MSKSGFYNANSSGQPSYTADDFNNILNGLFSNGIIKFSGTSFSENDALKVELCSTIAKVTIKKGVAIIDGKWFVSKTDETLTVGESGRTSAKLYLRYTGSDIIYDIAYDGVEILEDDAILLANVTLNGSLVKEITDARSKFSCLKTDSTSQNTPYVYTSGSRYITYTHGLNKYPAVTAISTSGDMIIGDVTFDSLDKVTVSFSETFAGTIYFN